VHVTRARAEEVGHVLVERAGSDVAFLLGEGEVLFARGSGEGPGSATTNLIRGLHETFGPGAIRLLRNDVYATREPGPFTLGLVKVAAKRIVKVEPRLNAKPLLAREVVARFEPRPVAASAPRDLDDHAAWLARARDLLPPESTLPRHARDRRVAAILVSPGGGILGAALNTNHSNRVLHSELNVLLAHWESTRRKLAPGTRLYVTLEPCRACAGLFWELAEDPARVRAYYLEKDPGPATRNSVLDVRSNARRAFARTRAEREAVTLVQV
jgi:tRNA(Arg) A34 adenosine deaminase TadA